MQERSGQVRENRVNYIFGGIFFLFSWVRLGLVRFGAGLGFGGLGWAERYGYWDGMGWDDARSGSGGSGVCLSSWIPCLCLCLVDIVGTP